MNNIQRKGIGKMKIYKKVIACILTLMMFFAQMPVNVFAANQKNNIPLDIVLVLDVSGSMEDPITSTDTTKRITILKDSINQFIEEFAKIIQNRVMKNIKVEFRLLNLLEINQIK